MNVCQESKSVYEYQQSPFLKGGVALFVNVTVIEYSK